MSTAIATRQKPSPFELIVHGSAERIAASLPEHFTPAKLVQVLSIIAYKTPKLAGCVPESIITSIITAGSLGLDLTPALGECYLIPRFNKDIGERGALECQCQPGYHGLKKLAMQTGQIASIDPRIVREGEVFRVAYDPDLTFFHEPKFNDKAPITHVYCVTKLTNGERKIEVMTTDQIEAIRKRSKAEGFSPWQTDWPEMAKKTVFKRQSKYLPRSLKLCEAIELDNREYEGDGEDDGVREHHAINYNNNTRHGRTESYMDDATTNEYVKWVSSYTRRVNERWRKRWAEEFGEDDKRQLAYKDGNLLYHSQLGLHLIKWAKAEGLLNADDSPKAAQVDKWAAVAWTRYRDQVEAESARYVGEQNTKVRIKLLMPGMPRPEPLPEAEDESQEVHDALDAAHGDAEETWTEGRE